MRTATETLSPEVRRQPGSASHLFSIFGATVMKCSDLQSILSLYSDDLLGADETAVIQEHLSVCPLCRQQHAEYHEIRQDLNRFERPAISADLVNSLKRSIRTESSVGKTRWPVISPDLWRWLELRLMPYAIGVTTSVTAGLALLTIMFSGLHRPPQVPTDLTMVAADRGSSYISQKDIVRSRMALGPESPSVNPQGALIALTKSFVRGGMKDDEVVVVADVFGDGLAQIAQVVEPSNDKMAVGELERAFEASASDSPFVPAVVENRPESVRVVLRFQTVNVKTGVRPNSPAL